PGSTPCAASAASSGNGSASAALMAAYCARETPEGASAAASAPTSALHEHRARPDDDLAVGRVGGGVARHGPLAGPGGASVVDDDGGAPHLDGGPVGGRLLEGAALRDVGGCVGRGALLGRGGLIIDEDVVAQTAVEDGAEGHGHGRRHRAR